MLCHLYHIIASILMLSAFRSPLVHSTQVTTVSSDSGSAVDNHTHDYNQSITTTETIPVIDVSAIRSVSDSANGSADHDLSASSSAHQLTWVRSTDGDLVGVKTDPSVRNSSHFLKNLIKVFAKSSENREDSGTDLGLPPDIANEYIDAVNPPKFRIPVQYGVHQYITPSTASSHRPVPPYENRIHAGSSVVKTKANFTTPTKSHPILPTNDITRTVDLATLLKAELDVKKDELDQTNVHTPAPNLFALLPNTKTENPFDDSNYKTPNRAKASTHRPYITSPPSATPTPTHSTTASTPVTNVNQFVYSDGRQSIRVNLPTNRSTIAVTTPSGISFITTSSDTKVVVLKSTTTARPVQYTKLRVKSMSTSRTTPMPSSTTSKSTSRSKTKTTSKTTVFLPPTTTTKASNKSIDWSSRVNNQTSDQSSESNDSNNSITGLRESSGMDSHEISSNDNVILRSNKRKKPSSEDYYSSTESTNNKTDYTDFDYDNSAVNPNYTIPDPYSDFPNANYRLTTERLAYILIGSCCALSILCLIVVAMSVRCRDMCDEYRSWKKAEKAAMRWQRHQYRMAHHRPDLSRYFRTSVEPNGESSARPSANVITAPTPLYGQQCCHCISCSSSWLFRDANKANRDWCCQRGYYHPTPRAGKLPFGAASSVNTFMPRYGNNGNNGQNCCDEQEGDTDSLNTSELLDTHHNRTHHFEGCNAANARTAQTNHRQLRRIPQPSSSQNWIHSSEIVDELHKKHSNINNVSRDQTNINNFRARNRQIGNENIVVWNNNNDERLI